MAGADYNKTIRRDKLKRHAAKGELFVKCCFHYTDDYAWDAAINNGKSYKFIEVYLNRESKSRVEREVNALYKIRRGDLAEKLRPAMHRVWDDNRRYNDELGRGKVKFDEHDFATKSGGAYGDIDGVFTIFIHRNLVYDAKIIPKKGGA